MIINDLDDYYIVFDTKNRNTELDTLTNCLTAMFEELFFPSGESYIDRDGQLSLF